MTQEKMLCPFSMQGMCQQNETGLIMLFSFVWKRFHLLIILLMCKILLTIL
jgi:hypothetical protein